MLPKQLVHLSLLKTVILQYRLAQKHQSPNSNLASLTQMC